MKKCIKSGFTFLVAISILFGECMLPFNAKASDNTTTEVQSEISKEVVGNQTDASEITNNNDANQDADTANDVDTADDTEVVEEPDAVEKPDEISAQEETVDAGEQEMETQAEEKVQITGLCWQNKGSSIDVGAAYTASADSVEFKWQAYNLTTQKWSVISDWSAGNWSTWHPESAGAYWLHVEARTGGGAVSEYTICFQVPGVQLSVSGICWVNHGSSIDFGAAYQSNDSNTTFQWQAYDLSTQKWTVISDWSTGNWMTWKPSKGGNYLIYVMAKNGWGQTASYSIGWSLQGAALNSFTTDLQNGKLARGQTATLKASYSNPWNQALTCSFIMYDGKTWYTISNDQKECTWTPTENGNYIVGFQLWAEDGTLVGQALQGCAVADLYANLNGIGVRYEGNNTIFTCVAADTNDNQIQYRWQYYDASQQKWGMISDWGKNKIGVTWTAPHSGYYWIYVQAKLHDGTTKDFTIGYTIQPTEKELVDAEARARINAVGGTLAACFNWSASIGSYYQSDVVPSGYTYSQWYAKYGFENGVGDCYVRAATFALMAQNLGYEAYFVMGYVPSKGGGMITHGWVEIVMNGAVYVCDPDFTNSTGRNGYMITYGTSGTWVYSNYGRVS